MMSSLVRSCRGRLPGRLAGLAGLEDRTHFRYLMLAPATFRGPGFPASGVAGHITGLDLASVFIRGAIANFSSSKKERRQAEKDAKIEHRRNLEERYKATQEEAGVGKKKQQYKCIYCRAKFLHSKGDEGLLKHDCEFLRSNPYQHVHTPCGNRLPNRPTLKLHSSRCDKFGYQRPPPPKLLPQPVEVDKKMYYLWASHSDSEKEEASDSVNEEASDSVNKEA